MSEDYECWYCHTTFQREQGSGLWFCPPCRELREQGKAELPVRNWDWVKNSNGLTKTLQRSQDKLGSKYILVPPSDSGAAGGVYERIRK